MRADVALAEPGVFHVGQLVLAERATGRESGRGQHRLGETGAEQRHTVDQRSLVMR